jgi:VIT1/CCC1 family predicted Fe2+/Mn2+ transporter
MQEQMPAGAEAPIHAGSGPSAPTGAVGLDDPRMLQILSTEHWSLLAGRSLSYNEAFSRAGMFLSFLSASLIVIGFLIGAQGLTSSVMPIVIVLLVADLFIGVATGGRLIDASGEELQCVRGMNRIRHAYREMVPAIEPYFVSSFHDDPRGVLSLYGDVRPTANAWRNMVHGLTTTIGMIFTIDAMIFGALVGLIVIALGGSPEAGIVVAIGAFIVAFTTAALIGMRTAMAQQARAESRFPSPPDAA